MGSRAAGKRRRRLRALPLIAASLIMMLTAVPAALAAQAIDGGPTEPVAPPDQPEPVAGPPGDASGVCDHAPGEFLVGYVSEEALQAAPPENVAGNLGGIAQHLVFEEIKNIPDPAERLAAEEAKRQELSTRPGVAYAEYNCVATIQAASAEGAADLPAPASCGDCGRYVVDRAKKIIADGLGDAEGSDAFDAALQAARSADTGDDNVAFASEIELDDEDGASSSSDDEGGAGSSSADGGSAGEGGASEDNASDDAATEGSGSVEKDADAKESATEEEADDEESSSGDDAEVGSEGEETGSDPETVSGNNAAATSEPREMGGSGGKVMALGAGALLLAAGVFVARRTFWS